MIHRGKWNVRTSAGGCESVECTLTVGCYITTETCLETEEANYEEENHYDKEELLFPNMILHLLMCHLVKVLESTDLILWCSKYFTACVASSAVTW